MRPCISQATTLNGGFEDDLDAYARAGWTAVEFWLTKLEQVLESRPVDDVKTMLADRGLVAPAASFQGGLLLSEGDRRAVHWDHYRRRLEILATLGVGTLILVPDFPRKPGEDDLRRALGSLAEAAELAGGSGVRLALEFQKSAKFCASLDTAVAIVAQVGSPSLGLCLDLFHYYCGPSKFEDLGYLSAENLAWVQISDLTGVPRELAGDSDRILPGDGDFQLDPILNHLAAIGYDGFVSLEVLNPSLWNIPPDRVVDIALRATERALGGRVTPDPRTEGREAAGP